LGILVAAAVSVTVFWTRDTLTVDDPEVGRARCALDGTITLQALIAVAHAGVTLAVVVLWIVNVARLAICAFRNSVPEHAVVRLTIVWTLETLTIGGAPHIASVAHIGAARRHTGRRINHTVLTVGRARITGDVRGLKLGMSVSALGAV
jgi:hypothetical protein